MSGGNFDYIERTIKYDTCEKLKEYINNNEFDDPEIEAKVILCLELLNFSSKLLKNIDYLIDGDIGDDTFKEGTSNLYYELEKIISIQK